MTPLHVGVSKGHIEVVGELASRADPSVINAVDKVAKCSLNSPQTPLIFVLMYSAWINTNELGKRAEEYRTD